MKIGTNKPKLGRRGKIGLSVLIAAMFIGVASAGFLTYYGKITAEVSVKSPVLFDGNYYNQYGHGYGDIRAENDLPGTTFWAGTSDEANTALGHCHRLYLNGHYPNDVTLTITKSGIATDVYGECDAGATIPDYVEPETCDIHVSDYITLVETVDGDGIDDALPGSIVCVADGTYTGQVTIGVADLTLVSETEHGAIIDANDNGFGILVEDTDLGDITIKGFQVEGWTVGGIVQKMAAHEGTTLHVLSNIVEAGNSITVHGNSIEVTGDGSEVIGNEVEITGYSHEEPDWSTTGILGLGNSLSIENNIVEYVTGGTGAHHNGIAIVTWGVDTDNADVRYNTVIGTEMGISVQGCRDSSLSGTTIEHNYIKDVTENSIESVVYFDGLTTTPSGTTAHHNNIVNSGVYDFKSYVGEGYSGVAETGIDATDNWWGCDGIQVSGDITATWYNWDDSIILHPWQTKHFLVHYTYAGSIGDIGKTVTGAVEFK